MSISGVSLLACPTYYPKRRGLELLQRGKHINGPALPVCRYEGFAVCRFDQGEPLLESGVWVSNLSETMAIAIYRLANIFKGENFAAFADKHLATSVWCALRLLE